VPGYTVRRVVSYAYDAAARLSSLSSSATPFGPAASVNNITYSPHGGLTSETYGNTMVHKVTYNNRLQPIEIKLGTSTSPASVLSLTYNYGTTNNNGNVLSLSYAGGGLSYNQTFGYDQLNRLTTSQETSGSTANWSQTNLYDRYGNRSIDLGGGNSNLSFSATSNRITTSGYNYDAAGNLLNDELHAYTYDAENKIKTVDAVAAYIYDGEGQRVRKLVGENLRFVYGIGGQLIAEYSGSTGALAKEYIYGVSGLVATITKQAETSQLPGGTLYLTSDTLGSPRVAMSGRTVVSRHDFKPFGEELFAGTGGRTATQGYSVTEGLRQRFTRKERDSETGLDYFGARYYANLQGRFTEPDRIFLDQGIVDPQSWNLYSYVRNNPLQYVDDFGEKITYTSPELEAISNAIRTQSPTFNEALSGYEGDGAPDLTIGYGEAGKDDNGVDEATGVTRTLIVPEGEDGSEYPAKPVVVTPARLKSATITIDNSQKGKTKKTEDVLEHEVGHGNHARKQPKSYSANAAATKQTKGATQHDKRPNEIIANGFRNQVNAERKNYEKRKKEEEKQKKREEKRGRQRSIAQ
jgi:RHS repeat-associated protein